MVLVVLATLVWAVSASAAVVVETVEPAGVGHRVGVEPGEGFHAWELVEEEGHVLGNGPLDHPFDFVRVRTEVAPRGSIRLRGPSGAATHELPWEEWGLRVRPDLAADTLDLYEAGRDAPEPDTWVQAAEATEGPLHRAWLLAAAADRIAGSDDSQDEVDRLYEAALEAVAGAPAAQSQLHRRWGDTLRDRSDWERAREQYRTAEELDQRRDPEGLGVSRDLLRMATVAGRTRDLHGAQQKYERAIAILRERARPGPALAESLGGLSFVVLLLGDTARAGELAAEATAIVE